MNRIALETNITPTRLARFEELNLLTETLVNGFMSGLHPSLFPGSGYEFSQLRSYQPGDPVNRIDWKLYSRSDRYFIREAEKESKLSLSLWLDSSTSMTQVDTKLGITKFRYAIWLTACIAKIGLQQGDDVAFSCINQIDYKCPSASGDTQLTEIIRTLNQIQPKGELTPEDFEALKRSHQPSDLAIVISDSYQNKEEFYELLNFLTQTNRDIFVFGLINDLDKKISNFGEVELTDLETGHKTILSRTQLSNYQELSKKRIKDVTTWCASRDIKVHWVNTQKPLDEMLYNFLCQRLAR
ncbi:MAG: DUF58 domain-containing protein [Gammaproteobacteria bacterium]|nr:DUF58 domain-containing protein [Gammaproteobacteria bacterium]